MWYWGLKTFLHDELHHRIGTRPCLPWSRHHCKVHALIAIRTILLKLTFIDLIDLLCLQCGTKMHHQKDCSCFLFNCIPHSKLFSIKLCLKATTVVVQFFMFCSLGWTTCSLGMHCSMAVVMNGLFCKRHGFCLQQKVSCEPFPFPIHKPKYSKLQTFHLQEASQHPAPSLLASVLSRANPPNPSRAHLRVPPSPRWHARRWSVRIFWPWNHRAPGEFKRKRCEDGKSVIQICRSGCSQQNKN